MRLSRLGLAALFASLSLLAAGCGGSGVEYEEVPGPPTTVTVPESAGQLASTAADEDEDADADATPTPTADAGTGTTTTPTTPSVPAATATPVPTAPPVTEDSGGTGAPSEDATNNEFDAFCNENPGACD